MQWSLKAAAAALVVSSLWAQGSAKDPKTDPDQVGNRDVGKGVNFYSLEKEIALGRELAQEVERNAKVVSNPVIAEYVNRVGQNLVRNSDAKVPFTIKVLESEEVNAFALPGGFFFVNTGLVLAADNEAELAGVMAHEIAHVAARHGTRQASRAQVANLASIPAIAVGGWTGYAIRQGMGVAIPMQFLAFSRSFEREADYLGLQYLYKTGYDPTAFVDFFEKIESLEKKSPGTVAGIFSTHPMTDDRIAAAQSEIQRILKAKSDYVVNTAEFEKVKDRLARLQNRPKTESNENGTPRLRRTGTGPIDRESEQTTDPNQNDRPRLKRRGQTQDDSH